MTVFDAPPSSGRKKLARPPEIAATMRSRAIRGFMRRIHGAIDHNEGVVLIAPPEDALELQSVLEAIALQRGADIPINTRPPIYDAFNTHERGIVLYQADQLPNEQQERLVGWMRRRAAMTQPVFAIFTSERRWRYCTRQDTRAPTSQRDRLVHWSDELLTEFMPQPIKFPELKHRQDDLLGILLQTLEAIKLDKEQTDAVLNDTATDMLLHHPPLNVLLFVNDIRTVCKSILKANLKSSRRPDQLQSLTSTASS